MALKYSQYSQMTKLISDHLTHHESFITNDLVKDNPPEWYCENKKLVYKMATPKGADSFHGKLEYTRWEEFPLPKSFNSFEDEKEMRIEVKDYVFDYSPPDDDDTVIWYVNFADRNLFGYYGGNLFAQDESQCLEHPALCSLGDYLRKRDQVSYLTTARPILTISSSSPSSISTPILIRGVERKAQVKTDANASENRPFGLYGNTFALASPNAIKLATTIYDERIDPRTGNPYYSNIIAIEAPKYGRGNYKFDTIKRILATAYSGFLAAKFESLVEKGILERNHEENQEHTKIIVKEEESVSKPRVIIHTGNWGCGAYGGNVSIMSCLQIAAAHLAGVDKLIYHALGNQVEFNDGLKVYNELIRDAKGDIKVDDFIQNVESKGFQWGFSNGT
ncbi:hypothetical protein C1645_880546 [Glomus cerebriforme]|uniref:PARG catalytic Macro domain-containing protein n=1 Tax=Glomus cerebriforme TaxID=658196 RepID=A0A397SCX2_9GLOM|nr:hypothetical protein C1645_880546 [Glomus cerebriforme]